MCKVLNNMNEREITAYIIGLLWIWTSFCPEGSVNTEWLLKFQTFCFISWRSKDDLLYVKRKEKAWNEFRWQSQAPLIYT